MTPDMTARMVDGWAMVLVHSLWIGSAAALIVAALLQRLPAHRTDLRAGVAFAGVLLSLIGSIVAPFVSQPLWRVASEPVVVQSEDATTHDSSNTSAAALRPMEATPRRSIAPSPPSPQTSWRRAIVGAWLIGVAVSLVRSGRSHVAARRLVRSATTNESRPLETLLDEVARALGFVTRAAIKVTDRVTTPLVYGFWSPVILLPASLATGAAPETLRVVLAHELWHLRRGDLWQTVARRLVEAVLFYHPAVWWLSRQAEREREAACDAAAARVVGDGVPVATALLDVASLGVTTPAAAMGFGGGSLAERVQRLLRPSEQPRVRVAWGGLLAMSLLGVAALVSLTAGTGLVAREVVVAMTPAERVAAIEQAIAENEPDASTYANPFWTDLGKKGVNRSQVTGRFVTPSGEPIPSETVGSLSFPNLTMTIAINSDGAFEVSNAPQEVPFFVQPNVEGYASKKYGPYVARTAVLDLGELKLDRGFAASLTVIDEGGEPLDGVAIVGSAISSKFPDGRADAASFSLRSVAKASDSNGVIEIDHLIDTPISITLQKAGYQRLQQEVVFAPGESSVLTLRRSQPMTGRFIDAAGKPVVGVELYCVSSEGDSIGYGDPRLSFLERRRGPGRSRNFLAISDAAGEFVLDSLKGDATYSLLALHKDYQPVRLDEARAGQQLGDIITRAPLEVRGRVLNADASTGDEGPTQLNYSNPIAYPSMSFSSHMSAPLDEEGRFALRQILPGEITFHLADKNVSREIINSLDNIEIDGDKIRNWQAKNFRPVRVRIKAPDNQPLRGTVLVTWTLDKAPDQGSQRGDEYLDIPTAGEPVVETQAPIGAVLWFNDHRMVGAYNKQSRLGVLPPGEGVYETTVTVEPAGLAVGQVVDARGKPLPGCTVRVRQLPGSNDSHVSTEAEVNADGRFSLGPLPLSESRRYACEAQINGTWRFVTSDPFAITAAKPIHEVKLTAPDPVYLTGQVLDHRGKPAAEWPTGLEHANKSRSFHSGLDPLDDEGRFRIAISPGPTEYKYTLQIRPAHGSAGLSLRYSPGRSRRGKDFGVVRLGPGGIVRGVVTTSDGKPAPTNVMLTPHDYNAAAYGYYLSVKTNDQGEFEIEGVEQAPQNLSLISPNRQIVDAEPASALVKEQFASFIRVTPTDEPTELCIVVSDEK